MNRPATETLARETVVRAFEGKVAPVPIGLRYRLALAIVAIATLLLPALYLGIVVGAGWSIYLHATRNAWIMHGSDSGGGLILKGLAYFGPIVAGSVFVFFMWKPLLARAARRRAGIELRADEAPLLFTFVEQVRRAIEAPDPREIRLDTEVNASAGFRRGLLSFLVRNDLVLTIGLPLIQGMTARQLAGVLGHELGHFAQGSSMRLTYLIRSVNGWLMRVAYERDDWDEWLERNARERDLRIGIVLHAARGAVWASRKILAGLAIAGHAIGTFMLREMEYDADRYEARLAGSGVFAATLKRMRVLSVAHRQAIGVSEEAWRERRLCADLPGLTVALAERFPPEVCAEIEESAAAAQDGQMFDTHPPDAARIASAARENAPGVFRLDLPAQSLLGQRAEDLSMRATRAHYEEEQELPVAEVQILPLPLFLQRFETMWAEADAAERFFGGAFDLFRPLRAGTLPGASPALASALAASVAAREAFARVRATLQPAPAQPAAWQATQEAAGQRLSAALALLLTPEVRARVDTDALDAEVARLRKTLDALAVERNTIQQMATTHDELLDLFQRLRDVGEEPSLTNTILERLASLHLLASKLENRFVKLPYVFDDRAQPMSTAAYATRDLPAPNGTADDTVTCARGMLERLRSLHERILGRLAVIAERLEQTADAAHGGGGAARAAVSAALTSTAGTFDEPA